MANLAIRKPYTSTMQSLMIYDIGKTINPPVTVIMPRSTIFTSSKFAKIRNTLKNTQSIRKVKLNFAFISYVLNDKFTFFSATTPSPSSIKAVMVAPTSSALANKFHFVLLQTKKRRRCDIHAPPSFQIAIINIFYQITTLFSGAKYIPSPGFMPNAS